MESSGLLSILPLVIAALVPTSLVVSAFLISRQRVQSLSVAVFVTSLAAGLTYLAVALHPLLVFYGFDARTMARDAAINDIVQLDLASSAMFVLVSTLAVVVVRYSRAYLAGQRELDRFARALLLTVASAVVVITSNNLAVLVVAWFATDVGLHQLLTFFRMRRQASSWRTRSSCSAGSQTRVLSRRSSSSAANTGRCESTSSTRWREPPTGSRHRFISPRFFSSSGCC